MIVITSDHARWPRLINAQLGAGAPAELAAVGNLEILALPKTALFCCARCPGSGILPTCDQAAQWRDRGRCVISGFYSPVEKECLEFLLRDDAPAILYPARATLERLSATCARAVAGGRMLVLSAFAASVTRITAGLAARRNEVVAALADEFCIAHGTSGGQA